MGGTIRGDRGNEEGISVSLKDRLAKLFVNPGEKAWKTPHHAK